MTTDLATINQQLVVDGLAAYTQRVNAIPMLTAEEELDLATRLYDDGDLEAAKRMVLSHLRFVAKVARGYMGYGLPVADLIQEGNVGLMKAVKRFDPKVGVRLVSYAVHWIKAEIHEFIIRNWRIVKVATTKAQRKLFFNLRSMKKRLGWMTSEEVADIASELGVAPKTVLEMESRLNARDPGFDYGAKDSDDAPMVAPADYLEDHSLDPAMLNETAETISTGYTNLYSALEILDDRSRDILAARWLNDESKATLHDLAAKYSISAERVRQIEQQAMKKLKGELITEA